MEQDVRNQIITLINKEVVPAIGCTEPMAVALCTARATELLGHTPEKIEACLSGNIIKNAMGVGIPGTGMIGLPIAIALGALIGKSEYGLEVLKDLTPETLEQGREYISGQHINIKLKDDISEKLYVEVHCDDAVAIISGGHTNFVYEAKGGEVVLDRRTPEVGKKDNGAEKDIELNMRLVYDLP